MKKNRIYDKNINIHHVEVDNRYFFIDGNTGIFSEESQITKEILELIPYCTEPEIYMKLAGKYNQEEIQLELKEIETAISEKVIGDENSCLYPDVNIDEKEWYASKILQNLWINISNDCNMRCIYCFEHGGNYGKEKRLMSMDTLKDCIDFWYKYLNKDAKSVYVIFFGGEPLFNKKGIKFAVDYVNKLLIPHGVTPFYNITTNATLLDEEFVDFVVENKIPVTISIDGGKEVQNSNRPLIGGHESYGLVEKNIKYFLKLRKYVTARVTLVHNDVDKLVKIVKDLWDLGFCQVQYDLVSTDDPKLKITDKDLDIISVQVKELANLSYQNIVNDCWKVLRNLTKVIDCINFPQRDLTGCSLYAPYTIMVDPAGEIYKCQRLMSKEFCSGDIYNGINWSKFYSHKHSNESCKKCWAKAVCNEGCPQVKLMSTGDINNNNELWCKHAKICIEEAVRLYAKLYMYNSDIFEELRIKQK